MRESELTGIPSPGKFQPNIPRMNPPKYEIKEQHNPETKQMDFVLTYNNGIEPSRTIRLPMHEAIGIIMEWLSNYSQAFPMLLKMNPAYEKFASSMRRLQEK
jgi:hypothetical protein